MIEKEIKYSVGALLYSPALNEKIAEAIISGQFGTNYSIALCLEDTIADTAVEHALNQLENTFKKLGMHVTYEPVYQSHALYHK